MEVFQSGMLEKAKEQIDLPHAASASFSPWDVVHPRDV